MSSRGQIINGQSGVSLQKGSWARLTALLGMPGNTGDYTDDVEKLRRSKYGLGDRRSLEQLIEFSGIFKHHENRRVIIMPDKSSTNLDE